MTKLFYEELPSDVRAIVETAVSGMRLHGPSVHPWFVRQAVLDAAAALPECWTQAARAKVMLSVGDVVRNRYRILQATEVEPVARG